LSLPVYIRELAKDSNGQLYNKVIYKFDTQKEPWHELNKK